MTRNTQVTPLVYGHRGAPREAPENTMAAFEAAVALGADGIEFDLRRSADDRVVIHHDPTYADGRVIAETPAADRPATVPLLEDVLTALRGRVRLNLELKNIPGEPGFDAEARIVDLTAKILSDHRASADSASNDSASNDSAFDEPGLLVSSFHLPTLDRVGALMPGVATGVLTFVVPTAADGLAAAIAGGHDAIHPFVAQVDAALVDAAHDAGIVVNVWLVNHADAVADMTALGVDAIITDLPGAVA